MCATKLVALKCVISRGGFSEERVFALKDIDHKGVCSRRYLWRENGAALDESEPALGQEIDGFVAARIIDIRRSGVLLSIPDGEVVEVPSEQLHERPNMVGEHVSI